MPSPSEPDREPDSRRIVERKRQHVELALAASSQTEVTAGWEDVHLIPSALPELDPGDVDLSVELLGHRLAAPIVLVGMTGGHPDAEALNAALGAAAQRLGLAVGVGSQRAGLEDPGLAWTFAAVRDRAPDALVIGNIGACQLVDQGGRPPLRDDDVATAIAMVGADALAVHLNPVQELVQPEGDRSFRAIAAAIERLVGVSSVPVVAKETGAGITREPAGQLARAGVAAIDVGGLGGTSFARIEAGRAAEEGNERGMRLGATFADWGVPTATSVLEVRGTGLPVIATGGVRTGLDAARALALGATAVGIGRPAIIAAQRGEAALVEELELFIEELRVALVLSAVRRPADLLAPVLMGRTLEWARQRGLL